MKFQIGDTVNVKDSMARVVRIIKESLTLYEDESGGCNIKKESYIQLRDLNGAVHFIVLDEATLPYEGPNSPIKGLEPN